MYCVFLFCITFSVLHLFGKKITAILLYILQNDSIRINSKKVVVAETVCVNQYFYNV